jgi:hypothetical protein
MPTYSESRRYNESIRFQQPVSPDRPAAKTWLASHLGDGFLYLTSDHQRFFVPVEQPPTSMQEWFDKTAAK